MLRSSIAFRPGYHGSLSPASLPPAGMCLPCPTLPPPHPCPGTGYGGLSTRLLLLIMPLIINGVHFILCKTLQATECPRGACSEQTGWEERCEGSDDRELLLVLVFKQDTQQQPQLLEQQQLAQKPFPFLKTPTPSVLTSSA